MLLNCGIKDDSWESLGQQGDKPVNPKGNQSWLFIGKTEYSNFQFSSIPISSILWKAETPMLCPPDVKNWLIGKDTRKAWRQEEKGTIDHEEIGWHHRLDRHEFRQVLGVGDWQGSLACCSPRGHKESDMTEWLNWTEPCPRHYDVSWKGGQRRAGQMCPVMEFPV